MAHGFTGGGGIPLNCYVGLIAIGLAIAIPLFLESRQASAPAADPAAVSSLTSSTR